MIIGGRDYVQNHTYVMGILNVTPDSFSDGGKFNDVDRAIDHVAKMIGEGVDIVDVGGESTRPGFAEVTAEEEMERTVPVIEAIKARFNIPISIDTYKATTAQAALEAGACLVNDVWGFKKDPKIAEVTARYDAACCLMHNRVVAVYEDFLQDMKADLEESINIALRAGVKKDKIMVDPGVGFAKSYEENLLAIKHVGELKKLGYPVLLATSRKSVIGLTLDLDKDNRLEGTLATTVYGVMQGCNFVRVHDVQENVRAIAMTEGILRA